MWNYTVSERAGKTFLYMDIPFADKDYAKQLLRGIRWSPERRQWYCPADSGNVNILLSDRQPRLWGSDIACNESTLWTHLRPHQQRLVSDMLNYRRRIIAAEMRTGKTLATLTAIELLAKSKETRLSVLWLAPKSGVVSVKQEIAKWKLNMPNVTLTLTNYEQLGKQYNPHQAEKYPELAYDVVVLDEGHRLKTAESSRSKLCATFYHTCSTRAGENFYIWLLSGTPSPKDPTDWWNICEIVHPGFLPWGSTKGMLLDLAKVKMTDYNGFDVPEVEYWHMDKVSAFQRDYVTQIATVVLKADVLELPEKENHFHRLSSTSEQKRSLAMIRNYCPDANTLLRKTMQISDGFLYTDNIPDLKEEGTLRTDNTTNPKLKQLREHLAQFREDGRLCVLAGFKESIDLITDACVAAGWIVLKIDGRGYSVKGDCGWTVEQALAQMDESNNPRRSIPLVVVGHPKSVATGLELSATANIIYYSMVTDGEGMFQSSERAHSMNMRKDKGCHLHYYFNLATDQRLYQQIQLKKELLTLTMRDLQEAITEELGE